ncbi:acetyl-CoA carboxylase biotin carboxylase subunit [Streptomyces tuirus]
MFETVLVANRGEIARRILRTARSLGIRGVAVHSDADATLPFVTEADTAVLLGGASPAESYRNIDRILAAAKDTGAQAVHPGYGFLSENAEFARAVQDAGLIWIGPDPEVIDLMGDKINARNRMAQAGVPVGAGTPDPVHEVTAAVDAVAHIGYPVMIKAAAGGGGMGMAVARDEGELRKQFEAIRGFAERTFGDPSILLERFFPDARHVEVQILGLADGRVVALGERDCSVQRRNQKVAEESPSPGVDEALRRRMLDAAVRAGEAVGYRGAGTVECLVSGGDFVFLEMNTRLQVEHPVTEAVFGIDLVEEQFRIAAGEPVTFDPETLTPQGHALELRINAEDSKRFLPGPGTIAQWREPVGDGIRVDAGYTQDNKVTPFYDSLMAKLIVHAPSREEALARAREAVRDFAIQGPKSNLEFFTELLNDAEFTSGMYDTGLIARMRRPATR